MACQPNVRTRRDEPFRRIPLIPLDRVAVINGKLMMEVMIAFSQGNNSSQQMISWSELIVKGRVP